MRAGQPVTSPPCRLRSEYAVPQGTWSIRNHHERSRAICSFRRLDRTATKPIGGRVCWQPAPYGAAEVDLETPNRKLSHDHNYAHFSRVEGRRPLGRRSAHCGRRGSTRRCSQLEKQSRRHCRNSQVESPRDAKRAEAVRTTDGRKGAHDRNVWKIELRSQAVAGMPRRLALARICHAGAAPSEEKIFTR